jgi:hypothetical protein
VLPTVPGGHPAGVVPAGDSHHGILAVLPLPLLPAAARPPAGGAACTRLLLGHSGEAHRPSPWLQGTGIEIMLAAGVVVEACPEQVPACAAVWVCCHTIGRSCCDDACCSPHSTPFYHTPCHHTALALSTCVCMCMCVCQVSAVQDCSKLELCLLVASCRLQEHGQASFNFEVRYLPLLFVHLASTARYPRRSRGTLGGTCICWVFHSHPVGPVVMVWC